METKMINRLLNALPLLLFTFILGALLLIRLMFNMALPWWGAWGLGITWGVMAFDYLLRAELFKQIGGFVVMLLAVLILIGALIPQDQVVLYPRMASEQLVHHMESTWNAVYTGNIFKTYSLKQQLIDYGTSLENFDPFRHGKMILFGLLGFGLAVVYLFPIEPFRPKTVRQRSKIKGQRSDQYTSDLQPLTSDLRSPISGKRSGTAYSARFAVLFLAGAVFALQIELLQVLSPTRQVTGISVLDSGFGLLIGLLVFVPVHYLYSFLAEHRAKGSSRFNVLGVGVDAVCMDDCLKLFSRIIEGQPPGGGRQRVEDGDIQSGDSFYNHSFHSLEQISEEVRGDNPEVRGQRSDVSAENGCGECRNPASARDANNDSKKIKTGSYFSAFMHRLAVFCSCRVFHGKNSDSLGVPQAVAVVEDELPVASGKCQAAVDGDHLRPKASSLMSLPVMTSALGVAGIIEARRNPKMQRILNEAVLNTPDGMPLVWLGKLFGYQNIERVYGPDLLRDVCAYSVSKGWKHFFYGAAPGIVEKLKAELERKHPNIQIAGIYCPPFRPLTPEEEADLIAQVAEAKPDIFWIGISTPKQLYFMDQMRDKLDCKIICPVGYAFDVNAGVQDDAPDWAKCSGFQWLHRAIKQPRLWKRYLPDNPRFLFEVMLQIFHLKKYQMFVHERITKPENDEEGYPRFPAGVVSLSAMTLQSARDRVLNWVATGQKHYVNICTADTMVQCFDRPDLAKIVKQAGMATTDGMPLVWLAHHYGFKDASRVYGPDLMLALCEATAALNQKSEDGSQKSEGPTSVLCPPFSEKKCVTHFFYGATDEVLAQLKTNLLQKFPNLQIAGMYSPPFRPLSDAEKAEAAEMINVSGADIVWCGLGTPKQDYWVAEFRPRLNAAAILAVGAAFNFHAGHVLQAPRWMMKSGLEWLFRLGAEPKRLWRRYIIGNPRFICLVFGQFMHRKRRVD